MSLLSQQQAERLEGEFSSGTLRDEDVGGALVDLLDSIGEELALGKTTDPPERTMACVRWNARKDDLLGEWERCPDPDSDEASEMVSEMFDLVEEALPGGWQCGSADGDGASFGVWRVEQDSADVALEPGEGGGA